VALLAVALVLLWVLSRDPGFVAVIHGAPAGSDILVDNVPRGTASRDGTIRVAGLEPGKRLFRVARAGYSDFSTAVSGRDGEIKHVMVQLTEFETAPAAPTEIDYNGPMILIPGGEFIMGDDAHELNERPAHKVTLPDFYIDKFEVTNAQYRKFCSETTRRFPSNPFWDETYFNNNPDSPVVGVNWHDAADYARWVGKRLPTEQEWEKAASWGPNAQKKRMWPWGETPDASRVSLGVGRPPVSGNQPSAVSAYGVHDLAGSVAEWVESYYQPYPGQQASDPNYGTRNRVVRGGHFRSGIDEVRATARYYSAPEFTRVEKLERTWLIGFRCAVPADDPKLQEFLRVRGAGAR
jgi:iron(II)-dependent oxidoreductase